MNEGTEGDVDLEGTVAPEEVASLLKVLVDASECVSGKVLSEGDAWVRDSEPLLTKVFFHCSSAYALAQGYENPDVIKGGPIVDSVSVNVLARAALEAYLMMFHIYSDDTAMPEVRKFRHDIWKLGGFLKRQKFVARTAASKNKKLNEHALQAILVESIKNSSVFAGLSNSEKGEALAGNPRLGRSWTKLGEAAGFNKKFIEDTYSHLSDFAHSGRTSIVQISQRRNGQQASQASFVPLIVCGLVTAKAVEAYLVIHSDMDFSSLNSREVTLLRRWLLMFNQFNSDYGSVENL